MPSRCLPIFASIGTMALASVASAADIKTTIGKVGTPEWSSECAAAGGTPHAPVKATGCTGNVDDCLHRVKIDTNEFANATCADGSPAVFHVRPGIGADADRWYIHLEGGGHCASNEDCLARWCGFDQNAALMSTNWDGGALDVPEHVAGHGINSTDVDNEFANWTHVVVNYCSSDSWMGRASDVTFSAPGATTFHLDARGHTALYAVRKMLRKTNADPNWTAQGYAIPDIDDAAAIVFAGGSAGAKGAAMNADWFLSEFPDAETSLVLDGMLEGTDAALVESDVWVDWDNDGVAEEDWSLARVDYLREKWSFGYYQAVDAFTDESCRDHHEPLGSMDRCSAVSSLLVDDIAGVPTIETPTFVRLDLEDPVISDFYLDSANEEGFTLVDRLGNQLTLADFSVVMRATLFDLHEDASSVSAAFGPRCGKHVAITDDGAFWDAEAPSTTNTSPVGINANISLNLHDALWQWLDVGAGARDSLTRIDVATGSPWSSC